MRSICAGERPSAAAKRFGASQAVVQLGAYATEAGVKMGWNVLSRRHRHLSAYVPASARFNGPRGTVYRLSLKGFASDGEARSTWRTYHLISDALGKSRMLSEGFSERVGAALAKEPTVLAPRRRPAREPRRFS